MTGLKQSSETPQKIVIIRLSSIGDILLTTPLIRLLRKRFPEAKIDFVIKTRYLDLLRNNEHLDRIYTFDPQKGLRELNRIRKTIREERYDLIIDIHKNFRSYFLRTGQKARVVAYRKYILQRFLLVKFGWNLYRQVIPIYRRYIDRLAEFCIQDDGLGLEFVLDNDSREKTIKILEKKGMDEKRPRICIAPGAGFATKRWPVEYYRQIAQLLVDDHDAQILLIGDKNDLPITKAIAAGMEHSIFDMAGQTSLMETACLVDRAQLVLTNDTGMMHLATALKKATIAIFGPTVEEFGFFPFGPLSYVVENDNLNCRPCSHIGSAKCPQGHFRCMNDITPAMVLHTVESMLIH